MSMIVTASFDDGSVFDTRAADLMDKLDIQTVFYIPVNYKKYLARKNIEPLTDEALDEIVDRFELGSHGVNHELLTKVDTDEQKYEIEESKKEWERRFNAKIDKFCYPRGYETEDIQKIVENAGYEMARGVKVGSLKPLKGYAAETTVHVGYDRKEYDGDDWLTYAEKKMDEAMAQFTKGKDTEFHFWGHSEEINRLGQWERFTRFLALINERLL